jgi:hypothetical protein
MASTQKKINKAKAAAEERYAYGSYSDKTIKIAKKQNALQRPDMVGWANTKKDASTLSLIQQRRQLDLGKTAARAKMVEANMKKKAATKKSASANKKTLKK